MPGAKKKSRQFGNIRKLPSGAISGEVPGA